MSNIWITSDTHWGHKNIVRGCSEWEFQPKEAAGVQRLRDFDTLEEHNQKLIQNFNELVQPDDILWHLGDWSFGGKDNIWKFREQLNCKNIHLVFGNHDQHIEPYNSPYGPLFSSRQYYKELSLNKRRLVLFHYGMRVWNKSHHGAIHLFGHSHGSLPNHGKSMDVGVDGNNLKPYHIDEIYKIMDKIEVEIVDHHNSKTN